MRNRGPEVSKLQLEASRGRLVRVYGAEMLSVRCLAKTDIRKSAKIKSEGTGIGEPSGIPKFLKTIHT